MTLVTVGNPILRSRAKNVHSVNADVKKLAKDMIEVMRTKRGLGLAAPQVGRNLRLIVVNTDTPIIMVNPTILAADGEHTDSEACLSVPGESGKVKRALSVTVRYTSRDGDIRVLTAIGLMARVIQHEIDHLDGILFIDKKES